MTFVNQVFTAGHRIVVCIGERIERLCIKQPNISRNDDIHILLRGQSNALGVPERPLLSNASGLPLGADWVESPLVQQWDDDAKVWENITVPLSNGRVGSYHMLLNFGRIISEQTGRRVRIIRNAVGATRMDEWLQPQEDLGGVSRHDEENRMIAESGATNVHVVSHHGEAHVGDDPQDFVDLWRQYEALVVAQDWFSGFFLHCDLIDTTGQPVNQTGAPGNQYRRSEEIRNRIVIGGANFDPATDGVPIGYLVPSNGVTGSDIIHADSRGLDLYGERIAQILTDLGAFN